MQSKGTAREEGLREERQQGLQQEIEQGKLETARKMKEENIDIALISKITNLSLDEIKSL